MARLQRRHGDHGVTFLILAGVNSRRARAPAGAATVAARGCDRLHTRHQGRGLYAKTSARIWWASMPAATNASKVPYTMAGDPLAYT